MDNLVSEEAIEALDRAFLDSDCDLTEALKAAAPWIAKEALIQVGNELVGFKGQRGSKGQTEHRVHDETIDLASGYVISRANELERDALPQLRESLGEEQ